MWTQAVSTCWRIGQRQPTVSKAAHWRVQVVPTKTPIAARYLESAYSAHVNITPTAAPTSGPGKAPVCGLDYVRST